jgi:uncharacterized protein (DUF2132 family)
VEEFYLYRFKGMPQPTDEEQELKPRERGFPDGVIPREPVPLTVKDVIPSMRLRASEEEEQSVSTFQSRFSKSRFRK